MKNCQYIGKVPLDAKTGKDARPKKRRNLENEEPVVDMIVSELELAMSSGHSDAVRAFASYLKTKIEGFV